MNRFGQRSSLSLNLGVFIVEQDKESLNVYKSKMAASIRIYGQEKPTPQYLIYTVLPPKDPLFLNFLREPWLGSLLPKKVSLSSDSNSVWSQDTQHGLDYETNVIPPYFTKNETVFVSASYSTLSCSGIWNQIFSHTVHKSCDQTVCS